MSDPPPFAGGAVGFFAYDLVRTVEPLGEANPDPLQLPDMALMLSDLRAKHPDLLEAVRSERELSDTTEKGLTEFCAGFARTFA